MPYLRKVTMVTTNVKVCFHWIGLIQIPHMLRSDLSTSEGAEVMSQTFRSIVCDDLTH